MELIWPLNVASSKRVGERTVAVKRSPTRDSLLDNVFSRRIFRFVPTGTIASGGLTVRLVDRLSVGLPGGLVCASAITGIINNAVKVSSVNPNLGTKFAFIVFPP